MTFKIHQPTAATPDALLAQIQAIHAEFKERYGSPRIHEELLKGRQVACCVNTVAKLMREQGLRAKSAKKFRNTTDSNHALPVTENVLDRQFGVGSPNQRWVADITFIHTREGWLYLAVVEDLFSRMVVGWTMADHLESRLVVDALEMAVARRWPGKGLLVHSDRGSQYASGHYQQLLAKHGIACSMSGVGQCWDNAPMESFFASLKKELVHHEEYRTWTQARTSIFEYIEAVYNPKRRHSSLGYVSPSEFEKNRSSSGAQPLPLQGQKAGGSNHHESGYDARQRSDSSQARRMLTCAKATQTT